MAARDRRHPRYGRIAACRLDFALALLLAACSSGCQRAEAAPSPLPTHVLAWTVRPAPAPPVERPGIANHGARLRLGFAVPGILGSLQVRAGDIVKPGQLLAQLRRTGAQASLSSARAARARARADQRTTEQLYKHGAASQTARDSLQSATQIADAEARRAENSLSLHQITATRSGTVLSTLAEVGEVVNAGMPVLVVEDTSRLVVQLGVHPREAATLAKGQRALVRAEGDGAFVMGAVATVAPAAGPDGLVAVEVELDARSGLWPGAPVVVQWEDPLARALYVPIEAIVQRNGKVLAFVIEDAGLWSIVHAREIDVDRTLGSALQVTAGLQEGDRIVREGTQFLRDGERVRVLP